MTDEEYAQAVSFWTRRDATAKEMDQKTLYAWIDTFLAAHKVLAADKSGAQKHPTHPIRIEVNQLVVEKATRLYSKLISRFNRFHLFYQSRCPMMMAHLLLFFIQNAEDKMTIVLEDDTKEKQKYINKKSLNVVKTT